MCSKCDSRNIWNAEIKSRVNKVKRQEEKDLYGEEDART